MTLAQDLQYAIDLARGAGRVVMDQYGKVSRLTKTHTAAQDEAVTEADRESQRFIVKGLRVRYAKDGVIGEENDTGSAITFDCPEPGGRVWVIDPIDGTNNFVAGLGNFAVCIGLLDRGMPVLGVVYDVTRDIVYSAAKDAGAWANNKPIRALDTPMSDSSMLMLTSNLLYPDGGCPPWAGRWISQTNWKLRMLGSAALEATMVAAGVAHGAITVNGKLWDAVAPCALVMEAGGVVTDLKGGQIFPFDLNEYAGKKVPFLAAGAGAHSRLLDELNR